MEVLLVLPAIGFFCASILTGNVLIGLPGIGLCVLAIWITGRRTGHFR